jgi:hypothetical protein
MTKQTGIVLVILITTFCACKKSTVLNATVVDKKTGSPLALADVTLQVRKIPKGSSSELLVFKHSDADGHVYYENEIDFNVFAVSKEGYLNIGPGRTFLPGLVQNKVNDYTIEMIPYDGLLRLKIENITGQYNAIYVSLRSPTAADHSPMPGGGYVGFFTPPIPFSVGVSYSKDFIVLAEEHLEIYWSHTPLPNPPNTAPFHASVYINRLDTTNYTITF